MNRQELPVLLARDELTDCRKAAGKHNGGMEEQIDLWHGYHNVSECYYHIKLMVKSRKAMFDKRVQSALLEGMKGLNERYAIEIQQVGIDQNHVRLSCRSLPKYSGGQVIRLVKSITGKKIFEEVQGISKELWGWGVLDRQILNFHDKWP
ncbi:MAG: IS200/IS605 family transposase [Nitrospiria bacterium]